MVDLARSGGGLGIIFSLFLGLMVTTFIGVGVHTFYYFDSSEYEAQIDELYEEEWQIKIGRQLDELTDDERMQVQEISDQRREVSDALNQASDRWYQTVSIILISLATLVMVISLIRAERLPVISNGILLGGVFTMLYGVGWSVVATMRIGKFIVITIALVITLGLGYIRFVRRKSKSVVEEPALTSSEDTVSLEQRVRVLEQRINQAANALSQSNPPRTL